MKITMLAPEVVNAIIAGKSTKAADGARTRKRAEYDTFIASLPMGTMQGITLDDGENALSVKNGLIAAAKRANKSIVFNRARKINGALTLLITLMPLHDDEIIDHITDEATTAHSLSATPSVASSGKGKRTSKK